MLTERANKRHCGIEGEEKPTSVLDGGEKKTDEKKLKKKQISKPLAVGSTAHGDRK